MTRTGDRPVPVVTVYRHGARAGVAPMRNSHDRAVRGAVSGWSAGATRRNTQFLYSVREDQLTGVGYAVTLTLRECPPSPDDWHRLRRAWERRMQRQGMIRMHWVTEWQRRGVPHLHGAVWFPDQFAASHRMETIRAFMEMAWCEIASSYGAGQRGQHVHLITGAVGWFQYLSKHASRGVGHYQRSPENIPPGWQEKTGRVWGKVGAWPVQEGVRIHLEGRDGDGAWFAYRRLIRSWRVGDSRREADPTNRARRARLARSMLRCNEQRRSEVRGISEWVPQWCSLAIASNLVTRGYRIVYSPGEGPADRDIESDRERDSDWLSAYLSGGAA